MHLRDLPPGTFFTYRAEPGYGVAQLIGAESNAPILHVRLISMNGSIINHAAILESSVTPYFHERHDKHPVPSVPSESLAAIALWREEYANHRAGAFSIPLPEVFVAVLNVLPIEVLTFVVGSAYPVGDGDVRVVGA